MTRVRTAMSGPTALFALGLVALAAGLWILAPWLALVVIGAGAMAAAIVAALPRREA